MTYCCRPRRDEIFGPTRPIAPRPSKRSSRSGTCDRRFTKRVSPSAFDDSTEGAQPGPFSYSRPRRTCLRPSGHRDGRQTGSHHRPGSSSSQDWDEESHVYFPSVPTALGAKERSRSLREEKEVAYNPEISVQRPLHPSLRMPSGNSPSKASRVF